jgi:hypothetical protein
MIQDNWNPSEEDLEWTREHFNRMQVGDTWGVADAVLKKVSDNHLNVESATPSSMMPLERIGKVCVALDIDFTAADAEIVHDPQEAAQKAALEWTHESGIPVSNFDMENAEWVCLDEDESWRVIVRHESDDPDKPHEVALAPMDYHLLAGDELFFSWKGMLVLEREEIIQIADDRMFQGALEDEQILIMTTHDEDGDLVPPHLRGLIFKTVRDEEE